MSLLASTWWNTCYGMISTFMKPSIILRHQDTAMAPIPPLSLPWRKRRCRVSERWDELGPASPAGCSLLYLSLLFIVFKYSTGCLWFCPVYRHGKRLAMIAKNKKKMWTPHERSNYKACTGFRIPKTLHKWKESLDAIIQPSIGCSWSKRRGRKCRQTPSRTLLQKH